MGQRHSDRKSSKVSQALFCEVVHSPTKINKGILVNYIQLTNSWNFPVTLPLKRTNVPPRLASTFTELRVNASSLCKI